MDTVRYIRSSLEYAVSFRRAVDAVARERKYLAAVTGFPEESTVEFVRSIVEGDLAQYFALSGERVVGWCDILPRRREGFTHVGVLGMGVLAEFRGKGIGRELLRMAERHAVEVNGIEKVELEVFGENARAIAFYDRSGFAREGVRVSSRKLDGRYDDIVLMGKFLSGTGAGDGTRNPNHG